MSDELEYRVLWCELIARNTALFSGRVGTFAQAEAEAQRKREAYNHHGVMIEARRASDAEWPRPSEWSNAIPCPERVSMDRLMRAIKAYRYWFDSCTRTLARNWEKRAAEASDELDAALEAHS